MPKRKYNLRPRKSKQPKKKHKPEPSPLATPKQSTTMYTKSTQPLFDKLPEEVISHIFSFMPTETKLCFSHCICKRFQSLPKNEYLAISVLQKYAPNTFKNLELGESHCHEAVLAGWFLHNYRHYIRDLHKESNLEGTISEDGILPFSTFRYVWMLDGAADEEMLQEDILVRKLIQKGSLYSPEINCVFTEKCFTEMQAFYGTPIFQAYSRLMPYNLIHLQNKFPLVALHKHLYLVNQYRKLNSWEMNLFKLFDGKDPKLPKGPVVHTLKQFEKKMDEEFHLRKWRDVMDWESFFLVGGSVVKCLLKESFEAKHQDLDFFFTACDYNKCWKKVDEIANEMKKKGYKVQFGDYGQYVNSFEVSFDGKNMIKFQFIWYDDNFTREKLLNIFDLDCCQVGYDGRQVLSTYAFVQSITTRTTINYKLVNSKKDVETFQPRTVKYVKRGFSLLVPKAFICEILNLENAEEEVVKFNVLKGSCGDGDYAGFLLNNDSLKVRDSFVDLIIKK